MSLTLRVYDSLTGGELLAETSVSSIAEVQSDTPVYLEFDLLFHSDFGLLVFVDGVVREYGAASDRIEVDSNSRIRAYRRTPIVIGERSELVVDLIIIPTTQHLMPIINPMSGSFLGFIDLTIESDSGTIYYSIDKSEPTTEYTEMVRIEATNRVRDIVVTGKVTGNLDDSEVKVHRYRIYPQINLARADIIDITKSSQLFDAKRLSTFSNIINRELIERYLGNYYDIRSESFYNLLTIKTFYDSKIPVRSFVKIEGFNDMKYVYSSKRNTRTGIQTIKTWDSVI